MNLVILTRIDGIVPAYVFLASDEARHFRRPVPEPQWP
jgi:hypothetical protein